MNNKILVYSLVLFILTINFIPFNLSTIANPFQPTDNDYNKPFKPNNPLPENESTGIPLLPMLSWDGGDMDENETVTYHVYMGLEPGNLSEQGSIGPFSANTTRISISVNEFYLYKTTYYWQVQAVDSYGLDTYGPIWWFKTENPPNHPPYKPSNPHPTNGALNTFLDIILRWDGGDPDENPVTYDLYFDTVNPPTLYLANLTNTYYNIGQLEYETTYFWKIIATDNQTNSTEGPLWNFTTIPNYPPEIPFDPSPGDLSTNVIIETDISWNCIDPEDHTIFYNVYHGITNPPDLIEDELIDNSYMLDTHDFNTTYFWKIIAHDKYGAVSEGPIWSYTTRPNTAPNTPIIYGDMLGKADVEHTYSVENLYDAEEDNIFVLFDWGDNTTSGWLGPYTNNDQINISHVFNDDGYYNVKAKLKDSYGFESNWSEPLNVQIDGTPPELGISRPQDGFIYFLNKQFIRRIFPMPIIISDIHIMILAEDHGAGLDTIQLYVDDDLKASFIEKPYNWKWTSTTIDLHDIKVVANDIVGNSNSLELTVLKIF